MKKSYACPSNYGRGAFGDFPGDRVVVAEADPHRNTIIIAEAGALLYGQDVVSCISQGES
jgi:hypothetical protein